jgi:hypothetical protein
MAALSLGVGAPSALSGGLSAILLVLGAALATAGLTGAPASLEHAVIGAALLAVTTAAALLGGGRDDLLAPAAQALPRPEAPVAPREQPTADAPSPGQTGLFDEGE